MTVRTTATLRRQAEEAEADLRWADAAILWDQAADRHPGKGALAERDIAMMRRRAEVCRTSDDDWRAREGAWRRCQRAIREHEAEHGEPGTSVSRVSSGPLPGWNFGGGNRGVIE